MKIRKQDALDYHEHPKPGKVEVLPTKPYSTQRDLSLAYSPGVAEPCIAIDKNPEDVYKYTAKGNLVAVISNGTAVLGLGDIGPLASKPVMEGKGVLFKVFADIDVFDIEVDATDVDEFVRTVKAIAPTFGGINLEDIKAPEAFEIEKRLKEQLNIPVMHDDQHGTAIISSAALLNALELAEKKIEEVKIVVNGAGASAISCATLYVAMGAKRENITMLDSKGVITPDREGLDPHKAFFARENKASTLHEAMVDADVFLGLSRGNIVSKDMVKVMAKNAIVFALANPDPEIPYEEAMSVRDDLIMATGRSDHPNQVNNVLGFPFIFRGALDVRATQINEEMKLAAVKAIAALAKEPVPEVVNEAYGVRNIAFGPDNIIPKPMDPRLITYVAPAVAKAAIDSGVAQIEISDWDAYKKELNQRMGLDNKLINNITHRARRDPKRVVFAEADNYKVLKAAQVAQEDGICHLILLGNEDKIRGLIEEYALGLEDAEIINPKAQENRELRKQFGAEYHKMRERKGMTRYEADQAMRERNYFGAMMVHLGKADAIISGITRKYKDVIRPALRIIGMDKEVNRVAGMYIMMTKQGPIFFGDATVNKNPDKQALIDITLLVAQAVKNLRIKPNIAMLSYSNFGSARGENQNKIASAVEYLHKNHPELTVDGEVQANFALNNELLGEYFPFSTLNNHKTNTLIFPNLSAGNISYKLIQEMGHAEAIGPILLGLKKSFHVLQLGCSVREIVNMIRIAVVDAQTKQ
jgi:malate dehydrogenase (oxaloacetate-decarboxylating)(NADP+)